MNLYNFDEWWSYSYKKWWSAINVNFNGNNVTKMMIYNNINNNNDDVYENFQKKSQLIFFLCAK